jgi:hypothetical protein
MPGVHYIRRKFCQHDIQEQPVLCGDEEISGFLFCNFYLIMTRIQALNQL